MCIRIGPATSRSVRRATVAVAIDRFGYTWALEAEVSGLDIKIVGAILIVVGTIAPALALLFWASFARFGRRDIHGPGGQL